MPISPEKRACLRESVFQLMQGHEYVKLRSSFSHQLAIGEGAPVHLGDGFDFIARKGKAQPGIHTFVKKDAHSLMKSPASSRKR